MRAPPEPPRKPKPKRAPRPTRPDDRAGPRTTPPPKHPASVGAAQVAAEVARHAPDPEILRRQRLLRAHGYPVVVDGIWGPASQRAWHQYLTGHGASTVGRAVSAAAPHAPRAPRPPT